LIGGRIGWKDKESSVYWVGTIVKLLAKIEIIKILANSSVKPGVPGEKP
jgi:hypothetical protein